MVAAPDLLDEALRARFEAALLAFPPGPALVALVHALVDEGHDQRAVFDRFDAMRAALQQQGRDFDEDAVMLVMDRISGWRAVEPPLFPAPLPR